MVAAAKKPKYSPPVQRQDIRALEPAPEGRQPGYPIQRRIAGEIGGIDCANAGSDDQVRIDSAFHERAQHADLRGSQATAASQHEGRSRSRGDCIRAHDTGMWDFWEASLNHW
jgi:hypothetical protein